MPTYKTYQFGNHKARITKLDDATENSDGTMNDDASIFDIEILVDEDERTEFLKNFNQKDAHWKTSSFTHIVQNDLARYKSKRLEEEAEKAHKTALKNAETDAAHGFVSQKSAFEIQLEDPADKFMDIMRSFSESFVRLEQLINNPPSYNRRECLDILRTALKEYHDDLEGKIRAYMDTLADGERRAKMGDILMKLRLGINLFRDNITELENNVPTTRQLRKLFSVQDESGDYQSLGSFTAKQMHILLGGGIEQLYEITGNRFYQLWDPHPAIRVLSDAKAAIEIKGLSLYGTRYNNSHTPIPSEMLDSLTRPKKPDDKRSKGKKNAALVSAGSDDDEPAPDLLDVGEDGEEAEASMAGTATKKTKKWLSIKPYVSHFGNIEDVDKILCHFSKRNLYDRHNANGWFTALIVLTNLFEFGASWVRLAVIPITFSLHMLPRILLLAVPITFVVRGIVSFLGWVSGSETLKNFAKAIKNAENRFKKFFDWLAQSLENLVSIGHHKLSGTVGVRKAKNLATEQYARTKHECYVRKGSRIPEDHQRILDQLKNRSYSKYSELFAKYGSGDKLADMICTTVSEFGNWVAREGKHLYYLLRTKKHLKRENAFIKMKDQTDASLKALVDQSQKALVQSIAQPSPRPGSRKQSIGQTSPHLEARKSVEGGLESSRTFYDSKGLVGADQKHAGVGAEEGTQLRWPTVKPWKPNEYVSILDFFDEIIIGLSDIVIDPMFRKSPGLATTWFIIANASFATLMAPGLAGSAYTSWLHAMPTWISHAYTGKEASQSLAAKIVAVFIEWKMGFFGSEAVMELIKNKGKLDFLGELLSNPEEITLGLVALIGAGVAMGYIGEIPDYIRIPNVDVEIPNPFAPVFNFFARESEECLNYGTPPFTGIEYAFLGLKFGLLTISMISGTRSIEIKKLDFEKFTQDLQRSQLLTVDRDKRKTIIEDILRIHGIDKLAGDDIYAQLVNKLLSVTDALDKQFADATDLIKSKPKNIVIQRALSGEQLDHRDSDIRVMPKERTKEQQVRYTWMHLKEMVDLILRMDMLGEKFESISEAKLFFDRLDHAFRQYNAALQAMGRFDLQIDKREYRDSFYNKYCYEGSTTLIRIINMVNPLTHLIWRPLKYALAKYFDVPSLAYQVKKSWAKDRAILIQLAAMTSRVVRAASRAYAYLLRGLCYAVVSGTIVGGIALMASKNFRKWVDNGISKIAPHRFNTELLKPAYARAAREAATNDDLRAQFVRLNRQLLASNPSTPDFLNKNKTDNQVLANITKHKGYETRKLLERVGAVINDEGPAIKADSEGERAQAINAFKAEKLTNIRKDARDPELRGACDYFISKYQGEVDYRQASERKQTLFTPSPHSPTHSPRGISETERSPRSSILAPAGNEDEESPSSRKSPRSISKSPSRSSKVFPEVPVPGPRRVSLDAYDHEDDLHGSRPPSPLPGSSLA